jgi:hypothetical protein
MRLSNKSNAIRLAILEGGMQCALVYFRANTCNNSTFELGRYCALYKIKLLIVLSEDVHFHHHANEPNEENI